MIIEWIAQALLDGRDHLILDTESLIRWHAQGCRVSLGAPWRLHGGQAMKQRWHWHAELREQLSRLPPAEWPVGPLKIRAFGNECTVVLPCLDATPEGSGNWRLSLIPEDPNHCLEAWSFDISLAEHEWAAIQPLARELTLRCIVRCEIAAAQKVDPNRPTWNAGRLRLAGMGGFSDMEVWAWFGLGQGSLLTAQSLHSNTCIDDWRDLMTAGNDEKYRREVLTNRRVISKDARYVHEVKINGFGLHQQNYRLSVYSTLRTTWQMCEGRRLVDLQLTREEMLNLRDVLEEHLGLREVPLPIGEDIAAEVLKNFLREEQRLASEGSNES